MSDLPIPRLRGAPVRVFVSVDETTGRSMLSFAPPDVGEPLANEDDRTGAIALVTAKALAAAYPGCTVTGPHFYASARGRPKTRRRR